MTEQVNPEALRKKTYHSEQELEKLREKARLTERDLSNLYLNLKTVFASSEPSANKLAVMSSLINRKFEAQLDKAIPLISQYAREQALYELGKWFETHSWDTNQGAYIIPKTVIKRKLEMIRKPFNLADLSNPSEIRGKGTGEDNGKRAEAG